MRHGIVTEAGTCREFVTSKLVKQGWSAAPYAMGELCNAALVPARLECIFLTEVPVHA